MAFVPVYILILFFTILIDYFAGIYIDKSQNRSRKFFLIISLIANIGILAVFKYYNFFVDNINEVNQMLGIDYNLKYLSIILPIGLSFHTFQAMSYTIEVYRKNQKAEKNLLIYTLYVLFYPQLVAGPIERPQNLLPQFHIFQNLKYENITNGLKLILWGFFKKLVIADRLAIYVNSVYNNVDNHNSTTFLLATLLFAIQIYCDFSAYSEIAIGTAKTMGYNLMQNFNRPYFSRTISEFWRRWHISLSTWFKDYLYISLGGNRVSISRAKLNLFIVFLISGLWHGASWNFVIWGGLNGIYLIVESFVLKKYRINRFIGHLTTIVAICFSWIFFRANSFIDAQKIVKSLFHFKIEKPFIDSPKTLIYSFIGLLILFIVELRQEYFIKYRGFLNNSHFGIRLLGYTVLVTIILCIGVFDGGQFIYFQF